MLKSLKSKKAAENAGLFDQKMYYYGIYFGLFETRGCRYIYEGTGRVEDLKYPLAGQNSLTDKKFVVVDFPDSTDAGKAALVKSYVEAVQSFAEQFGKQVDGLTIVFPSFPHNMDVGEIESKLREFVNKTFPDTTDDNRERVFVLEEKTMWEGLVPDNENHAVLHVSDYFFLTNSNLKSSKGISGDPYTLEGLGISARNYVVEMRERKAQLFHEDEIYRRAKQVFGVLSYEALMDFFRLRNTVPNWCRFVEKMAEINWLSINNFIARAGKPLLDECSKAVLGDTSQRRGVFTIIVLGSITKFFPIFSQDFVKSYDKLRFVTYEKPEMRDRAEVAAAVYGARMRGQRTDYLKLSTETLLRNN